MLISRKQNQINQINQPILYFNNVQIVVEVQTHKHLGTCIYLTEKCGWQVQLDYIESKAWPRIFTRIAKIVLDRRSLQAMYFSFIRPVFEYADVVWDNCTDQQSEDLEKKIDFFSIKI